ncbi:MAG: 5'-nucleotidase [Treponema sp.]|nr:5'-nucleotidase [Treponema sp.]
MKDTIFTLGVDLDGVVGDFYGSIRKIAADWLNKPLETLTTDVTFGLDEWGISEYGGYDRLHRYAVTQRNIFRDMEPIENAPAILRKLSCQEIRIRIITHRLFLKYSHRTTITQTVDWLDNYDIPYWDICFMNDKGAVGAHVYIDDSPENITSLRNQGCKTIVFSNSTNKGIPGPRANNWHEVEKLVMEAREEWRTGAMSLFTDQ